MATRLPTPGGDYGDWGAILNSFLEVSLASDGTLNPDIVGTSQLENSSVTTAKISASGTPSSATYLRGDGTWTTPNSGTSSLASDTDVTIASPVTAQVLTYNSGLSKWINAAIPTATNGAPGLIQLSGSLGGTATNPTVVTNANLTGDVTSTGNATTLTNSSNVQTVVNNLIASNSNVTNKAPLASPIFTGKIITPALQVTTGNGTANDVLISDTSGNATWGSLNGTYVQTSEVNAPNGVAPLDGSSLVPIENLPVTSASLMLGGLGAPSNSVGMNGDYYIDALIGNVWGPKASNIWPATPTNRFITNYDVVMQGLSPLGWWKLADNSGSGTAADSGTNGYTATVHGGVNFAQAGPVTPIATDTSALFNGSTGYISCPSTGSFPTLGSAIFWMNPSRVTNYDNPFNTGPLTNYNNQLRIEVNAPSLTMDFNGGGMTLVSSLTTGSWYFIAVTWNMTAGTATGYVNATSVGNASGITTPTTNLQPTIGTGFDGSRFFNGYVAQVAVFNYQLSAAQLGSLYAAATV